MKRAEIKSLLFFNLSAFFKEEIKRNLYKIIVMSEVIENIVESIESALESASDYGKTSYELVKLKTIDKTSDVVSSLIPHAIVFLILMSFLLFINIGLAFYLGEIFRNIYYGFFVVAAFYGIVGIVVHFFFHDRMKSKIFNCIIKQALK